MSSEPPPNPVCDNFNYSQWNATEQSATQAWVKRNFLSRVIADIGNGLISFVNGIKTNSILVYSGTTLNIGAAGSSISIYNPTSSSSIVDTADNSAKLPSTSWVQLWFSNIQSNVSLSWSQVQDFVSLRTNLITPRVANTAFNIYSADNERSNINILCGEYSGTTSAGNLNIMSGIMGALNTNGNLKIQDGTSTGGTSIGNALSSLDLKAGTITLYKPFTPNYSYTSLGTGTGKVGEIRAGTYVGAGTMQSGTSKTYSVLSLTATGVYHIQAQGTVYAVNTSNVSVFRAWIDSDVPNAPYGNRCGQYTSFNLGGFIATTNLDFSISSVIYNVGTSPIGTNTYRIYVSTTFTGAETVLTDYNFKFLITRIA